MAWLISRIEPAEDATKPGAEARTITRLATRHRLAPPEFSIIRAHLAKHGWEMPKNFLGGNPIQEWPYTAYTYISQRKDGVGRAASALHRIPVRKAKEPPSPRRRGSR